MFCVRYTVSSVELLNRLSAPEKKTQWLVHRYRGMQRVPCIHLAKGEPDPQPSSTESRSCFPCLRGTSPGSSCRTACCPGTALRDINSNSITFRSHAITRDTKKRRGRGGVGGWRGGRCLEGSVLPQYNSLRGLGDTLPFPLTHVPMKREQLAGRGEGRGFFFGRAFHGS